MAAVRDPGAARRIISLMAGSNRLDTRRIANLGMTERQRELNWLKSWYHCAQYETQPVGWDGESYQSPMEAAAISTGRNIPPGHRDSSAASWPIKQRRPLSPYQLARNVIDTFTSLLFGERTHPRIRVLGDSLTEDYFLGLAEAGRLWAALSKARADGGAMGTSCMSFKFVEGELRFEVHDPRWVRPTWTDNGKGKETLSLAKIEIRWMYQEEVPEFDGRTTKYKPTWFWSRRIIDDQKDTTFEPVEVEDGDEPEWVIDQQVEHGYGFCPAIWVQNLPTSEGDIYGECDIHGGHDMLRQIDELTSGATYGIKYNCVSVDTPFITASGVRTFANFADGDQTVVLTHAGRWKKAVVRCYGTAQLYSVTLGRGRNRQVVRATGNHRWLLEDDSVVQTDDLCVGRKLRKPPHLIRDWAYEEADEAQRRYWAYGFIYGDGTVGKNKTKVWGSWARLCGAKARFVERFAGLGYNVTYPPSNHGDPCVFLTDYTKTLPGEDIGVENLTAFVRGYLDADGSRNLKHPETSDINPFQGISATGEASLQFIRTMFPVVGAYIVGEDDRTEIQTGFGSSGDSSSYFSLVLGFSNSSVSPYIVRGVVPDAVEPVWCLEVEDDHSFVLPSGVVTCNSDPTTVFKTGLGAPAEVKKGTDNAIVIRDPNGNVSYLEMTGTGLELAMEQATKLRGFFLEMVSCVLDQEVAGGPDKTATEIVKKYGPMWNKVGKLREQWGELAVKPLLKKIERAVRMHEERGEYIVVPPKVVEGDSTVAERQLGPGGYQQLEWPPLDTPTLTDINTAVTAMVAAVQGGVTTKERAVRFLAPYIGDEDPQATLSALEEEAEEMQAQQEAMMMGGMGGGEEGGEGEEEP